MVDDRKPFAVSMRGLRKFQRIFKAKSSPERSMSWSFSAISRYSKNATRQRRITLNWSLKQRPSWSEKEERKGSTSYADCVTKQECTITPQSCGTFKGHQSARTREFVGHSRHRQHVPPANKGLPYTAGSTLL